LGSAHVKAESKHVGETDPKTSKGFIGFEVTFFVIGVSDGSLDIKGERVGDEVAVEPLLGAELVALVPDVHLVVLQCVHGVGVGIADGLEVGLDVLAVVEDVGAVNFDGTLPSFSHCLSVSSANLKKYIFRDTFCGGYG
jgi:hypothetical protein